MTGGVIGPLPILCGDEGASRGTTLGNGPSIDPSERWLRSVMRIGCCFSEIPPGKTSRLVHGSPVQPSVRSKLF